MSDAIAIRHIRKQLIRYALATGGLAVFFCVMYSQCGDGSCSRSTAVSMNVIGLTGLATASIWHVSSLLRKDPNTLWIPAMLYPLGTALYFAFGSSVILFGNEASRSYLTFHHMAIGPDGLLRTQFLTTTGVTICVLMMVFVMGLRLDKVMSSTSRTQFSLTQTAIFFLLAGTLLKYGLILPQQYGFINITVPGALKSMASLIDLGFAVAAFLAVRGSQKWQIIFWVLWPLHLGLSSLEFSKKVMMIAILLPAAGAYLAHQNWKRLIPFIIFAIISFISLQSINTAARLTIMERTGDIKAAGLGERFEILTGVLDREANRDTAILGEQIEKQTWWLRLNYSGAQLRAMTFYDTGYRGEWTLSIAATLVPRFLWPDKPVSTAQGRIFNRLSSGNIDSRARVAMSVYGDGYWQMGWTGLVIFSMAMGAILGFVSRVSYRMVSQRQLIYFPVVFLGLQMSVLGPMGYFQKSFVASFPIFLGYIAVIYCFEKMLLGQRKPKPFLRPTMGLKPN